MGFWPDWDNDAVVLDIRNDNPVPVSLNWIHIYWPVENGKLKEMWLGGSRIWNNGALPPMYDTYDLSGADIPKGEYRLLRFNFEDLVIPNDHIVDIEFEYGCFKSASIP